MTDEYELKDLIHYTKDKSKIKYYKPLERQFTSSELKTLFPIDKPAFIKKYNLSNESSLSVLKEDDKTNMTCRDIITFDDYDRMLVSALYTTKQLDLKLPFILELLSVCYWTNDIEHFFEFIVIADQFGHKQYDRDICILAMIQNIKELYNGHYCVYDESILVNNHWTLFGQFWSSSSIDKSIHIDLKGRWWDCKYDFVAEMSNNVTQIYINCNGKLLSLECYVKLFRFIKCLNTTTRTKLLDIRYFNHNDVDKFINGLDRYICNIDVLRFYYYDKKPDKISNHIKNSNYDIKHIVFI